MAACRKQRSRAAGRLGSATIAVVLLLTASSLGHAGPARLVKDIERASTGCSLSGLVPGPGALYVGTDSLCRGGLALWRTDGSAAGTRLVRSFDDGSGKFGSVQPITAVADELYFGLREGPSSDGAITEIWRTDGTGDGTLLVWQASGEQRYHDDEFVAQRTEAALGDKLVFVVDDGYASTSLWVSDGTPEGTHQLRNLGDGMHYAQKLMVGDGVVFVLEQGPEGHALWRTDGTTDGTWLATRLGSRFYEAGAPTLAPDGNVYFPVNLGPGVNELWRTGGTPESTSRVLSMPFATTWVLAEGVHYVLEARRIGVNLYRFAPDTGQLSLLRNLDPAPRGDNDLDAYGSRDGIFYASQYSFLSGRERLWRSDGTAAGTSSLFEGLVENGLFPAANGFLFSDAEGGQIWYTNGTAAGTRPVLRSAQYLSHTAVLPGGDATLFAVEIAGRWELWRTDGTRAGTAMVRRLAFQPGRRMTTGEHGVAMALGSALWISDGNADGTFPVVEFGRQTLGAAPADLTPSGDDLYFTVSRPLGTANELWRSDGTRLGTVRVVDFPDGADAVRLLTPATQGLLFARGVHELWTTDGSGAGTRLLAQLEGGIREILEHDGAVLVAVDGPQSLRGALLRVDPQDRSTSILAPTVATDLVPFAGGVYFAAPTAAGESAVWRTDGSTSGTTPMATFAPRAGERPDVGPFFAGDGVLYFGVAYPGSTELWRSDGTGDGTTRVATLDATLAPSVKRVIAEAEFLDGALLFSFPTRPAQDDSPNLWRSDGTKDGTWPVAAVPPFRQVAELTPFDGRLAFRSPGRSLYGFDGAEPGLWATNATGPGTVRLFAGGVVPGTLITAGADLYFCGLQAGDGSDRPYLWRSDGSAAGTHPVGGRPIPCLGETAAAGGSLFVPSTNRRWGAELWSVPLAP